MPNQVTAPVTAETDLSDIERIEIAQEQKAYRAAIEKQRAGKKLTKSDLASIEVFLNRQMRTYGERYLQAMPKEDFIRGLGITHTMVLGWSREHAFPYHPHTKGVNVWKALRFLVEKFKTLNKIRAQKPDAEAEVENLLDGASEQLKDELLRERIIERRMINEEKKISLEKARESVLPLDAIVEAHNMLGARISKAREQLTRYFDGEDKERVESTFDDLIDDFKTEIEQRFLDDSES